jgi:hypothetical protein
VDCQCSSPEYDSNATPSINCTQHNFCLDAYNGACDNLTHCVSNLGFRTCTACPFDYNGSGETGCVPKIPVQTVTDVLRLSSTPAKRGLTTDYVAIFGTYFKAPSPTVAISINIGGYPCVKIDFISAKRYQCYVTGQGANREVEVIINGVSNIPSANFIGSTVPRYDFSDNTPSSPLLSSVSCVPPFGAADVLNPDYCNCWSGFAASTPDTRDCNVKSECAAVSSPYDQISIHPPLRPETAFKDDKLWVKQVQPVVKNRRDTIIQWAVPAIPVRNPADSVPGTLGFETCGYPGNLWEKKVNRLDCLDEYYGILPWSQHDLCGFVEDIDPSNALNLVRVFKSNLINTYTEYHQSDDGLNHWRKVSNAFLVTVTFVRQIKTVTQYAVYIIDHLAPAVLNVDIVGDALYDVASKNTIITFETTLLWPYQIASTTLDGIWAEATDNNNPGSISAEAVPGLATGDLVCNTQEDTDCEQSWILTINTQPNPSDPQVCNLKGKLTFSTQNLLCRDLTDASNTVLPCIAFPVTNFTLSLGKTDLCDSNDKVVDTAGGMTEVLESFYDADRSLPQNIFQTGDMVYFNLIVNNPSASIDTITFNSIRVGSATFTPLYWVDTPGTTDPTYIHTSPTSQINTTTEIRDSLVRAGQDALLQFNFRLLRNVIGSLVDLSTITAGDMQRDLTVEVVIDIWYHGNEHSVKRTLRTNAPLPAVAHAQIAYYLSDLGDAGDDNNQAVDNVIEDENGFSLTAAAPNNMVATGLVFILAIIVAIVL